MGTSQVKESKVDMLITQYEAFNKKEGGTIQEMLTRFIIITNELHYLCEVINLPNRSVNFLVFYLCHGKVR